MRNSWMVALSCLLSLTALPVRAQEVAPLPSTPIVMPVFGPSAALTADERHELDDWLDAMRKWQRMDKRWHNEPAHDAFGRIRDRAAQPDAPGWLEARCTALGPSVTASQGDALGSACRIVAGVDEDPTAEAIRASTAAARADKEKVVKNSFLTRIHIDGLWTTTSTDYRMYGLVGSHISLVDVGRVQFFGPPGVILLSVPDGAGSREIRAGYTWGMSIRLGDVRLFAQSKNLTLFLTVTKVWVTGGAYDSLGSGGFDIAGFSLAPRRHSKP